MSDQVLHPYKTTSNCSSVFLNLHILDSKQTILHRMTSQGKRKWMSCELHKGTWGKEEKSYRSTHSSSSHWVEVRSQWSASPFGRLTAGKRAPGGHWIGGCVGPRADLDGLHTRKIGRPCRKSSTTCQPVTIPTRGQTRRHLKILGARRVSRSSIPSVHKQQVPPCTNLPGICASDIAIRLSCFFGQQKRHGQKVQTLS